MSVPEIDPIMESPFLYIASLSNSDRLKFCEGMLLADVELCSDISFQMFGLLMEIAVECASNRNNAIRNMLSQLNKEIDKGIDISGLVRKFKNKIKKIEKVSEIEKEQIMKETMLSTTQAQELKWLDMSRLQEGVICTREKFTNNNFIELCSLKQKYSISWPQICNFLKEKFSLENELLPQTLSSKFSDMKSKIAKLSKNKSLTQKSEFLKQVFCAGKSTEIAKAPTEAKCADNIEISNIEESFQVLSKSFEMTFQSSLETLQTENDLGNNRIERLMKQLETENRRNIKFKEQMKEKLMEKNEQIAHLAPKNVKKREDRKTKKIENLKDELETFKDKLSKLEAKTQNLKKNDSVLRSKVSYYKGKLEVATEKLLRSQDQCLFYENLSCEQQEKIDDFEKGCINTFKGGKYTDEIRTVYYEMLRRNVSVDKCGEIIRVVLEKLANVEVEKLPKKSLVSTMLVELETLSKLQVREALLSNENNTLHIDGTKYNFDEIGGFQVTTASGSYTIGIENMHSGEASTYLDTLKNILQDMSTLVMPEEEANKDVQKILFSFKSLMTDRTIMNSTFFEQFNHWRKDIIPFVVENYDKLPENEKEKISRMHHVFCGLHVLHNLGIYAEQALQEWEKVVEEAGSVHGGFKSNNNSRTYSLLYELSKLTSYTHGDQKSGKASEWRAFLEKKNVKDHMVSFLHHRFNILFVLGGAMYFHREQLDQFVNSLEGENFLHQAIKQDITEKIFIAAARALGIMNKLITGPLFRKVVEKGHIFDLNDMWLSLLQFLEKNSTNAHDMLEEKTFFEPELLSKDEIYSELFKETDDPLLDTLTQECLELINCTCMLMVKSQLKDQLPGGKYFKPSSDVREEIANCPRTNIISERDFAQYDQKLKQKPTLTTIAACGVIMFNNNKTAGWLNDKSKGELEKLVKIARTNKNDRIKKYKVRRRKILEFKIDSMEKRKLEREIRKQKEHDEKEKLTSAIQEVGGLITSTGKLDELFFKGKYNENYLREILKNQIKFRKKVLGQKFSNKKFGQMGETVDNCYNFFDAKTLRNNLEEIIGFVSTTPAERADNLVGNVIKDEATRKRLLEEAKVDFRHQKEKTIPSASNITKNGKKSSNSRRVPMFFGKIIRHKMIDNGEDIWYRGTVTAVLDDDEYNDECEFTVEYEGFDDTTYDVTLIKEWRMGCIVIEKKAECNKPKRKKNK